MTDLIRIMTLLDWTAEHARCLSHMRLNTERWMSQGLLNTPGDVRVKEALKMHPGRPRKANAG